MNKLYKYDLRIIYIYHLLINKDYKILYNQNNNSF